MWFTLCRYHSSVFGVGIFTARSEAPPIFGLEPDEDEPSEPEDEAPDLDAEDEDEDVRGPAHEVDAEDLTPQGRYRAAITDDPAFVWRVPRARFLTRSTGEAARCTPRALFLEN